MRKIALVNQKGGVGKTTTAANLAAGLARLGRKVLLIDFDPQANATISFGINVNEPRLTVYDVLRGEAKPEAATLHVSAHLDLLPSSIDLAGAEVELNSVIGRELALRDALSGLSGYEYVLVDCPPSLGLLNVNALAFVDEVFIPLQCEYFALHGISLLMKTIELVQRRIHPALRISGVVACMYDARTSLSKEVVAEIGRHFKDRVFRARIRTNVRLAEAPSHGQTIFDYAPESAGAEDYLALAKEVSGVREEASDGAEEVSREDAVPAPSEAPSRGAATPGTTPPTPD